MQTSKVREINFTDFQEEILHLREKVWKETNYSLSQQVFTRGFLDKTDFEAFHWGIFDKDKALIASSRLSVHQELEDIPDIFHIENLKDLAKLKIEFPIASLNRLVVDKKYQGRGIGKIFDKVRFEKSKNLNCKSICGMTHGSRVNKLQSYGFSAYPFLIISNSFKTDVPSAQNNPPAFCYKALEIEIQV